MAKFRSLTYESLRVADIGVRFVDGFYETKAKGEVARLRGLADLGVVEVKPEKAPAPEVVVPKQDETAPAPDEDAGTTDEQLEIEGVEESAPEVSTAPKRKSRTA